jgi:hypothetical protein
MHDWLSHKHTNTHDALWYKQTHTSFRKQNKKQNDDDVDDDDDYNERRQEAAAAAAETMALVPRKKLTPNQMKLRGALNENLRYQQELYKRIGALRRAQQSNEQKQQILLRIELQLEGKPVMHDTTRFSRYANVAELRQRARFDAPHFTDAQGKHAPAAPACHCLECEARLRAKRNIPPHTRDWRDWTVTEQRQLRHGVMRMLRKKMPEAAAAAAAVPSVLSLTEALEVSRLFRFFLSSL